MDFFDKLGKKASETYKVTAEKTGKIAKEAKIKLRIGELKANIADIYENIGEKVYEKHKAGRKTIEIKKDLNEECEKLDNMDEEIYKLKQECLKLQDKKQCKSCKTEIEKSVKFCPNCGSEQYIEEEIEEIDKLQIEIKDIEVIDKKPKEEIEKKAKNELEKTVKKESAVETNKKKEDKKN